MRNISQVFVSEKKLKSTFLHLHTEYLLLTLKKFLKVADDIFCREVYHLARLAYGDLLVADLLDRGDRCEADKIVELESWEPDK